MSGFLMWQAAYAEFHWEVDHLPDMTPDKLRDIISREAKTTAQEYGMPVYIKKLEKYFIDEYEKK